MDNHKDNHQDNACICRIALIQNEFRKRPYLYI